jgi:hypothetical protein
MKKVLPLLIVFVLVLSGFGSFAISKNPNHCFSRESENIKSLDDELDQYQTECTGNRFVGSSEPIYDINIMVAQSFIPQLEILTRIEFYLRKNEYFLPHKPLNLFIREESLSNENLATASVNPSVVPYEYEWIEFVFDDIPVTAGQTYWMVAYMEHNPSRESGYIWGMSDYNPYHEGLCVFTYDGGEEWQYYPDEDTCFKTYGRQAPLQIVKITGGIGKVSAEIKNNLGFDIENINWSIFVEGGLSKEINVVTEDTIDILKDGDKVKISTDKFIFGLGLVKILVTAESEKIAKTSIKDNGFALFFFILIY